MKKVLSVLFIGLAFVAVAQNQIQYKVLKNDPVEPRNSLNLEFMNMDVNTKFVDNLSFNVGLFGYSKVTNNLNVAYQINKSYMVLGRLLNKQFPGNLDVNAGIQLFLSDNTSNRTVDVVLDSKDKSVGNTTYTLTKSVSVPATVRKKSGIEGGAIVKRNAFEFLDTDNLLAHTSIGIYAGILSRKITNIVIYDDNYGNSFRSFGSDIFFDALILPVNTFKSVETGLTEKHKSQPFGFRCGYRLYQVEKKEFTGKKFGISGTASFGYRPFQGWNLSAGIGISILKH
jgi:hypothetical protein